MGLLDTIKDYVNGQARLLTPHEINVARQVFEETLPYSGIMITSDLGAGGAPWTEPSLVFRHRYYLHLGATGYASTLNMQGLLIHELTHVWQGCNHIIKAGYVAGSLTTQALSYLATGGVQAGYNYTPGELWGAYNTEQQASIVEDWYNGGMSVTSPLFCYIRDNIRRPVLSWFCEVGTQIGEGASAIKG